MQTNKYFYKLFTSIALCTLVFICWFSIDFMQIKAKVNFYSLLTLKTNVSSNFTTLTHSKIDNFEPLNLFFEKHAHILNEKNASHRKIIFSSPGDGGYGNRMYTVISSTLIAILLECQLVIFNWRNKEALYINPPMDLFDQIKIDYSLSSNQTYHFPHPTYPFNPVKDIKYLIKKPYELPSNFMRYLHSSGRPLFTELSANILYYGKFKFYKLAREDTLDKAFEALKDYSNFTSEELQGRVLDVAFEIGGNILNRIWIPNQEIKNEINNDYMEKWFKANYVIGLQMRGTDSLFIDETKDHLKFINCALEIEKQFIIQAQRFNASFKWFIATDSDQIRKFIFDNYKEKAFTSNGILAHTSLGAEDGFRRAVLDVELLSRCNEIIVTSGSTFGWLAAMKMLKMPYVISGSRDMIMKCTRMDLRHPSTNPHGSTSF